jgi:prevent-host-death family protein
MIHEQSPEEAQEQVPTIKSRRANGSSWQIQTAKARFSELFRKARAEGPQLVTRQGKEGVVIISDEQYEQLVGKARQPRSLAQFFRQFGGCGGGRPLGITCS